MRIATALRPPQWLSPRLPVWGDLNIATVFDAIGNRAHALSQAAPAPRGYVGFRQTNEFFYCCGLEAPHCYLLMDGAQRKTAIYLPPRGEALLDEGAPPGVEDASLVKAITGADQVWPVEALSKHLTEATILYAPHAPAEVRAGAKARAEVEWAVRLPQGQAEIVYARAAGKRAPISPDNRVIRRYALSAV